MVKTFTLTPGCSGGSWCSHAAPEMERLGHREVARGTHAQPPQVWNELWTTAGEGLGDRAARRGAVRAPSATPKGNGFPNSRCRGRL